MLSRLHFKVLICIYKPASFHCTGPQKPACSLSDWHYFLFALKVMSTANPANRHLSPGPLQDLFTTVIQDNSSLPPFLGFFMGTTDREQNKKQTLDMTEGLHL